MKLRLGFVSNSSTTSFCICGYNVDVLALSEEKQIELIKKVEPDFVPEKLETTDRYAMSIEEYLKQTLDDKSIGFDALYDSGDCFYGSLLCTISDDGGCRKKEKSLQEAIAKCEKAKEFFGLDGEAKIFAGIMEG